MALSIATNVGAMTARRAAASTETGLQRAVQRLSTGLRINAAADDAAGLAISDRMTAEIRGATQARRNINDASSFLQVAEGVMSGVVDKLQRVRELAVQAANPTYGAADKASLQAEAQQLLDAITQETNQASFNGQALFSSSSKSIGGDEDKRLMLDRLKLGWFKEAEDLIRTHYGIEGDGAAMRIDLDSFTDGPSNVAAHVQGTATGDGTLTNLVMRFDMQDFAPPNESSDRIVAHELVHAVMARTMNFTALPQWFVEGVAELITGADERLAAAVAGSSAAAVVGVISGGGFSYEGGYAASRYLHDALKDLGVTDGIKSIMQYLDANQSADLDAALNAVSGGVYADEAAFLADFGANGANFITNEMDLANDDTGAIGGYDADGGAVRTSALVIDESKLGTDTEILAGFKEEFQTVGGTTETKRYVLQIGENVGDTMEVELSAMNASALGLDGIDLGGLAGINIMHLDQALDYVNSQRASIGGFMARLDSIATSLEVRTEALSASRSRVQDADYAVESAALTRTMILQQSALSVMAQANAAPQVALALLR